MYYLANNSHAHYIIDLQCLLCYAFQLPYTLPNSFLKTPGRLSQAWIKCDPILENHP